MKVALPQQLRSFDGPLTRELVRQPGQFGLGQVPAGKVPDATTRIVCGFCSTGCSLDAHLQDGSAVNLTPTVGYPVNLGMACPKGWEALTPLDATDRATVPLLRRSKGESLEAVDWPTALDAFVRRMRNVQTAHGPDSVAFLSTGQIVTEEMALLGALAKFGMGFVHGDGNTRQCMATSVVAYKEAFGFDAPPYTYADFEESDTIVLVGSNLAVAHPIMWERVQRNRRNPNIVVIDPRRTETAVAGTHHLALAPKTDLTLLYGLAHLLIANDCVDHDFVRSHTTGFAAFASFVEQFPPYLVARETGIEIRDLHAVAEMIRPDAGASSFWWTMGVNQSHQGVRTAQAIINLALLTGNIGKPGTGANSITGQCNAMGSRLFSNTASMLGGRDFTNAEHRAEVAQILGLPNERIADRPSLAYDQIIDGIAAGKIKGLWVLATNTAHSWINQTDVRELLARLDFLVVQDMYTTTETALMADLVLPAAGWGEKDGTFINSERRIGVVKRVRRSPGQALSDFAILKLLAEAWGVAELFEQWSSPEAAFGILQELSRGRPCDITGIGGYRHLDDAGGIQWPFPSTAPEGPSTSEESTPDTSTAPASADTPDTPTGEGFHHKQERRLFADGHFFHPDGRARFVSELPVPPVERPSRAYPLVLLTGRSSAAEWHTRTRTGKSAVLRSLSPQHLYVELHPGDAADREIEHGDTVRVESARGHVEAVAVVTATVQPGNVFLPMHDPATNVLTFQSVDPYSRQPSYKYCAVEVRHPGPR